MGMATSQEITRLQDISRNTRKVILETLAEAGSGHPGGSLSAVELLVTHIAGPGMWSRVPGEYTILGSQSANSKRKALHFRGRETSEPGTIR